MTVIVDLMPTRAPGSELTRPENHSRVRIVTDPDLGDVLVRWRNLLPHQSGNRWRCRGCGVRSSLANACPHILAAAIDLAEDLLGLTAAGVPTSDHTNERTSP